MKAHIPSALRFLSRACLLEPCGLSCDVLVQHPQQQQQGEESGRPGCTQAVLRARPANLLVSQGILHALTHSHTAWQQAHAIVPRPSLGPDLSTAASLPAVLMTHYVVCNDLLEGVRLGQQGTDETILLAPRQAHLYAWRTNKVQRHITAPEALLLSF